MICPKLSHVYTEYTETNIRYPKLFEVRCFGPKCAWWVINSRECAVLVGGTEG